MVVDKLWQSSIQLLAMIEDDAALLNPASLLQSGTEPTPESLDLLRENIDRFEAAVEVLASQVHWDDLHRAILASADPDALYTHLRAVNQLDEKLGKFKCSIDNLVQLHDAAIRDEGYYPNDLASDLSRQLSRSLILLMPAIDVYRSCVRNRINALTRAAIRPLNVLHLPDELLTQIFGFIRVFRPEKPFSQYSPGEETRCIQNIRLTCRRFNATSSHMLIDYVYLELMPESLSRLQEIAQHLAICKGIRAVEVDLAIYHSELATDLRTFATVCSLQLARELDHISHLHGIRKEVPISKADLDIICSKCRAVKEAWERFATSGDVSRGSENFVEALRTSHQEYQQRYQVQRQLLEGEAFAQVTVNALAQMPYAKVLKIEDHLGYPRVRRYQRPLYELADSPLEICRNYMKPYDTRSIERIIGLDCELPLDVAVKILAAMPKAGVAINDLRVDLPLTGNIATLVPDPATRKSLCTLAKQLKHVSLRIGPPADGTLDEESRDIYQFMSAILNTESLEVLSISFHTRKTEGLNHFSIGPILNCQRRPYLSSLHLQGVAIHGAELQRLFGSFPSLRNVPRRCPNRRVHITLTSVNLLSGSWATVLDSLRAKVDYSRIVLPMGAECTTMSEVEFVKIFTSNWAYPGLADLYVQNYSSDQVNPLFSTRINAEDYVPV
ncbi:hypothetical protein F5Y19DRAFT_424562 [Xylariaceae sp. FL1651]|nr:hypothetical protein F5Y19DRAFT_424562 [Xylariaceae sp. FL1651]